MNPFKFTYILVFILSAFGLHGKMAKPNILWIYKMPAITPVIAQKQIIIYAVQKAETPRNIGIIPVVITPALGKNANKISPFIRYIILVTAMNPRPSATIRTNPLILKK